MRKMGLVTGLVVLAVAVVPQVAQAKTAPGSSCKKVGAITTISRVKYRCTKSAKGLTWKKVATVIKPVVAPKPAVTKSAQPTPTATPTPTPTASPSATPTPSESPSAAPSATPTPTPTVSKSDQTISTTSVKSLEITEIKIPELFSSSSHLPVSLKSETPLVCGIKNSGLLILQTGNCSLVANQAGDNNFEPAKPISLTVEIIAPKISTVDASFDGVTHFIRIPKGDSYASETAQISLSSVTNDASAKICASDETADGCTSVNGAGVVDPASETRYVEFVFRVKNLDSNPLPSVAYRLLISGDLTDVDSGVTLETLNDLTVNSGQTVNASLFAIVPKSLDLTNGFLAIDAGITVQANVILLELN